MSLTAIINTYSRPQEVVPCAPVTVSALLLHLLPGTIQCATLYPALDRFRWLRQLRLALTPLNLYCGIKLPIDYCFTPATHCGYPNLGLACASFVIISRAIEWGSLKSYREAKVWKRPEFDSHHSEQNSSQNSDHSKPVQPSKNLDDIHSPFSFQDWFGWTLEMVSSVRGQQYGWGVKIPPHTESFIDLIKRMYTLNIIHVFATGFAILCRDEGSAKSALRRLGLPRFYGDGILGEGLLNLAFGFYLITMIELGFAYVTVLMHLISFIDRNVVGLPKWLMRSCNLKLFSPLFNQPHRSHSLAHLWGKAWHQMFRQSFLVLGGFPATHLAKKLGFPHKFQRLAGVFGCFFISAVLHEHVIHFAARKPHPEAHIFYSENPGSFKYFIIQAIGIMIEPYIIIPNYIPGIIWSYLFTLVTVTPFRSAYFKGHRFLDLNYPPLSGSSYSWVIRSLLLPGSTALHSSL